LVPSSASFIESEMPVVPTDDFENTRLWGKRQRQILIALAVLAGCVFVPSAVLRLSKSDDVSSNKSSLRKGGTSTSNFQQVTTSEATKPKTIPRPAKSHRRRNHTSATTYASAFDVVELPIDPTSTLHDDIITIEHLPALSRIDVLLREDARCPRPYLFGRLSGPALTLIHDWRWNSIHSHINNTTMTAISGHYQLPASGRYHLEIIAIHCNDFLHNMKQQGSNSAYLEIDETVCVEDPNRHRVTDQDTTIIVDHTAAMFVKPLEAISKAGHWRHRDRPTEGKENNHTNVVYPLLTRFHSPSGSFWGEPSSTSTRGEYLHDKFEGSLSPSPKSVHRQTEGRICILGSSQSHQQQLERSIGSLLGADGANVTLSWKHINSPNQVTKEFARQLVEIQHCRKLVVTGMLPWRDDIDTIGDIPRPTKISNYHDTLDSMLRNFLDLREHIEAESGPLELYVIPIPYHPLDSRITACPPLDWRSPPVIDGCNAVIARVCENLGGSKNHVNFVDTRFVVDPMWDFGDNWEMYISPALKVESRFIAEYVLGLVEPGARSIDVRVGS
jgi:hypothetical protein